MNDKEPNKIYEELGITWVTDQRIRIRLKEALQLIDNAVIEDDNEELYVANERRLRYMKDTVKAILMNEDYNER